MQWDGLHIRGGLTGLLSGRPPVARTFFPLCVRAAGGPAGAQPGENGQKDGRQTNRAALLCADDADARLSLLGF